MQTGSVALPAPDRGAAALDSIGPNAGFFAGECVASTVEGLIAGVMFLAEGAEVVFAGPAVDGDVVAGDVGVPQQLGAKVVGRGAEELGPGAIGRIGGFNAGIFSSAISNCK